MFDFFRDIYFELNGIDSVEAEKIRKEKIEKKREKKNIFSRSMKVVIFILGILYLVMAGFNIITMKENNGLNAYLVIRFVFLILCDVAGLICLALGKKKSEIAALILIVIFMLTQYFTTLFM